jgi:signal transduction histidine kinase
MNERTELGAGLSAPDGDLIQFSTASSSAFRRDQSAPLASERITLASLVHHREFLQATDGLEFAYDNFRARDVEYMAVVRGDRVIGLCSRGQVGFILGSRFGFALNSRSPVEMALSREPLVAPEDTPVRRLLDLALSRHGDAFHEDVVLVDRAYRLLGLIRAETLAQLQSRLVAEQLQALREQQATLHAQNLDLFRAIHAARQSRSLYLGLFEAHSLGVALLDQDGLIHEHNQRLGQLLGFDQPVSLVSLVTWVDEPERDSFLRLLRGLADAVIAPGTREFTLNVPDRGPRVFRFSTGWIKETGQICACLDDITEQRILERNARRQEKQSLLDTLVGGIAHELNNKLTPVHGFAELLELEARGEAQIFTRHIRQSVTEAAHIIRQLLQLSKPTQSDMATVDLRAVVSETMVMLRFEIRAARCEVFVDLPDAPVQVHGNHAELKQVLLNLVLNALHALAGIASARLGIEVRSRDRRAELTVTDNGCGIRPENLNRIFDPFFTTKGPERGTGLGLSVCFGIVRAHGGEIHATSTPGAGARFCVCLPADSFLAPAPPADRMVPPGPGRTIAAQSAISRILVVDDEEVVRNVLQEMLRRLCACPIDLATNGAEALVAIARHDYALVLCDIQMPVLGGADLYERLLATHPELAKHFAFITGHAGDVALETRIARWRAPVVSKPFSLPQLAAIVEPLLAL